MSVRTDLAMERVNISALPETVHMSERGEMFRITERARGGMSRLNMTI